MICQRITGEITAQQKTLGGSLSNSQALNGEIRISVGSIQGVVSSSQGLVGSISLPSVELNGDASNTRKIVGDIHADKILSGELTTVYHLNAPYYEGDYEVTPAVTAQELKTKHKHMTDDVTINAIPFFNVSNTAGGNTVYIGSEI